MQPKILAFMQNQWFKNPQAVKEMFARHPDKRNEFIKRLLFTGCISGKIIRAAFGDLCDKIIWEEASPKIADYSASVFAADYDHMKAAIALHKPDLILCFGKIASDAIQKIGGNTPVLVASHPAARQNHRDKIKGMQNVADKIRRVYF